MTPYIAGNDGESRMADQSQYQLFETAAGIAAIGWKGDDITRFRLPAPTASETERAILRHLPGATRAEPPAGIAAVTDAAIRSFEGERGIGKASGRHRVCQYVSLLVVPLLFKQQELNRKPNQ